MFKPRTGIICDFLYCAAAALLMGAVIAIFQPAPYLRSWLPIAFLFLVTFFFGIRAWRISSGGKKLAVILAVVFFSRVILGVVLQQVLPGAGYDNEVQNAGYVYSDAYDRDQEAYRLAASSKPLVSAFSGKMGSDQYGGLLFISAATYRLLSPDTTRPILVTILGSFMMLVGLIFLFKGINERWNDRVAFMAAWVYALYPEGVLLGSSQMREPFLIGFFCIAFWAVLSLRKRIVYLILAVAAAIAISIPNGLAMAVIMVVFVCIDWISEQPSRRSKIKGIFLLGVLLLISIIIGWLWLKPSIYYDAYLTQESSGWVQKVLEQLGEGWRLPFITIYGLTQPLLPAAITDPSLPVWEVIAIIRSIGWYAVIPFLLYSTFELWKEKEKKNKRALAVLVITLLFWSIISSLRAGGDQWDNPRYRAILIPWLVIIIGWALQRIKAGNKAWFFRWLGVVLTFLLVFTYWYLDRYYVMPFKLTFPVVIILIVLISAVILVSGLVMDKRRQSRVSSS